MAEPIKMIKKTVLTEEEKTAQTLRGLTEKIAEYDEAMTKILDIADELHESGILEAVESLLSAKAKIAEIALGQVARPEITNLINNAMGAAGAFTALDPEQTQKLASGLIQGLDKAKEEQDKKVGMLSLIKTMKDPDINRALNFSLNFLKGFGAGLK